MLTVPLYLWRHSGGHSRHPAASLHPRHSLCLPPVAHTPCRRRRRRRSGAAFPDPLPPPQATQRVPGPRGPTRAPAAGPPTLTPPLPQPQPPPPPQAAASTSCCGRRQAVPRTLRPQCRPPTSPPAPQPATVAVAAAAAAGSRALPPARPGIPARPLQLNEHTTLV